MYSIRGNRNSDFCFDVLAVSMNVEELFMEYFGMKKKKDEEIELKQPDEDRVQTCERAICGMLDRLDAIEKRHETKDQFRKWSEENVHKRNLWEQLEHKGLARKSGPYFVLTSKGLLLKKLFVKENIEDIRSD